MHTVKKMIENVSWLFIGTLVSNFISVFVSIFLIRQLPVESFGIYSLFMGSLGIFAIFSINGIIVSLRRFIPEFIKRNHIEYLKKFVGKLYLISIASGGLILVIVYFFKSEVGQILQIENFALYYSIFIINILLFLQTEINSTLLTTIYEQKNLSIIGVISVLVRGALYAYFLSIITIELIFIIEAISLAVKAVPTSAVILYKFMKMGNKNENVPIRAEDKRKNFKRVRKYTLLSMSDEMGESALSQISDYYFISAYLGPAAMGLYVFPYKLFLMVFNWLPLTRINEVLKPFFISKYYEFGEDKKYLQDIYNLLIKLFLLLLGFITGMVIAYQDFIHKYIFDGKYSATETLLIVIVPYFLIRAFAFPNHLVLEICEIIKYSLYSKMLPLFNIIIVVLVLEFTSWELIGVAAATGLTTILRNAYLYYFIKKKLGIKIYLFEVTKSFSIILFFTLVVGLLNYSNQIVLQILLPFFIGTATFVLLTYLIKPFNRNELEYIDRLFNNLPPKFMFARKIFLAVNSH